LRDNARVCAELEARTSQDQTRATSSRSSMHEISTHFVNRLRSRAEAARLRPSTHRGRYSVRHIHSRRLPISFTSLHSINFSTISRKSRQEYSRRAGSNRLPLLQLRVIGHAWQGCAGGCKSPIPKRLSLLRVAACCTVLRSRWYQNGIRSLCFTRHRFLRKPYARV
jgi:hypothetical protein